ncbi:hypothetical protein WN55_07553 [Dufourea novaeangliae]|uniref:Uncharacterized protein n=1 Tax=Dufourea novaeangliae TaxID=178035 RepID=A0A154PSM1_DUFNO|nr:hypothetical protein WN55_07553 [Dufourea novaeangliae]
MIERWHRVFKAAIICHADASWSRVLSTVLLGLRSHVRVDTLQRVSDRVFNIDVNGSARSVSVELLKPAHFVPDNLDDASGPVSNDSSATSRPLSLKTYSRRRVTFAPDPAAHV